MRGLHETEFEESGYSMRDRIACSLCNWILNHIAGPKYRAMIGGSIRYGLIAAASDTLAERSSDV